MALDCAILKKHIREALAAIVDDEKLENCDITSTPGSEKGENYLGEIARIVLKGSNKKLNLLVKQALTDQTTRQNMHVHKLYVREQYVYSVYLPMLDEIQKTSGLAPEERFSYAKLFKAGLEEGKEFLIFEDLSVRGFRMLDRHLPYDWDHLKLTVKNLARYHAVTVVLKDKFPDKYAEALGVCMDMSNFSNLFKASIEKSAKLAMEICSGKEYEERFLKFFQTMHEELMKCWGPEIAKPFNVICHGDSWSNNFLYNYKGSKPVEIVMVDWQMMREASPVSDLAYMLLLNSDKQLRANHYEESIDLYYETLKHNVAQMGTDIDKYYPEHVYQDHIKRIMKSGLMLAVFGLPFIMGDKGEAVDLNSLMSDVQSGGMECLQSNELSRKRLTDVIEDSVKYGFF